MMHITSTDVSRIIFLLCLIQLFLHIINYTFNLCNIISTYYIPDIIKCMYIGGAAVAGVK